MADYKIELTVFIVIATIYLNQPKDFKASIRQVQSVLIMNYNNVKENVSISDEEKQKLVDKIDKTIFKPVFFTKKNSNLSYEIIYKVGDNDIWSMDFFEEYIQIKHKQDYKYYQKNHDLEEYVGAICKELGGK